MDNWHALNEYYNANDKKLSFSGNVSFRLKDIFLRIMYYNERLLSF